MKGGGEEGKEGGKERKAAINAPSLKNQFKP